MTAALKRHRIPVIDRMMEVLGELERREEGASISQLVAGLELPRSTVYRMLNSLQSHQMVQRDASGGYRLGRRLLSLAARASTMTSEADLITRAQPHLDKLAAGLGEGCKLSVIDDGEVLVLAAAEGRRPYALSVIPGQRMAPHAGAACKLLLAHLSEEELSDILPDELETFTARTFTDIRKLKTELSRVRRLGWALDRGESAISIFAFAAPVFNRNREMVGAISVPFLAGADATRMETIRLAVIETAEALSDELFRAR